jgi:hypothetical protein
MNGACIEWIGTIENIDCPLLLNAEGDYGCQGVNEQCMTVTVSLLDGRPSCVTGGVSIDSFVCLFPGSGATTGVPINDVDCSAIDITVDIAAIEGSIVICDHGTRVLNISE